MSATPYLSPTEAPTAQELQALPGAVLLEFGTDWCGHCRRAQPLVAQALAAQPQVRHLKVEDGPGRPLGRRHGVKLWPTLVLLRDGQVQATLVRPQALDELAAALRSLVAPSG